jgi:PAS domain S-box-containing protein
LGRTAATYISALGGLVAALLTRWLLDPWIGDSLPFVTLFGAVAWAAWLGGYRPAILVVVLGYVAVGLMFIPPRGHLGPLNVQIVVGIAAYVFTCGLIVISGGAARRAVSRAADQRELLRVTLRSIGDAVITTDNDGRVSSLNDVAESLTGWPRGEAIGQPLDAVFRILNEDTRRPVENPATRALREGIVVGIANHTVLLRRNGSECPIDDSAAPIRSESGKVSGCVLIFRDVSIQRSMERERAGQLHTARLLSAIVESSSDAIVGKTLDGTIRSWNTGAERIFGHTAAQAIGQHISIVIPPDRIFEEEEIIARIRAGDRIEHYETERLHRDGRRLLVSLTISPIRDDSGTVVGASKIARDVTFERLTEQRQRQLLADAAAANAKFQAVVENSTDFIAMCDLEGRPFFVNRAGLQMVGLDSLEHACNTPVASFFFPEDQDRMMHEFFPAVLAQGHGEVEVRFRHLKTGEARWMAYKVIPLPGPDGEVIGFATVSQDVTERRRMEDNLRSLAADLSQADRKKNEFLAILAHELRNPIAPISNAVRALRMGVTDADAVRSTSEMLERQVAQLARLVEDLLDVNRITHGKIELRKARAALTGIVQQAVDAAGPLCRNLRHDVTVTMPPHEIYVDGDAARLTQVVGNLLHNACKFTDPGGRIVLTVEQEGMEAVIRVRDTGIGIAAEHVPLLFEMFRQVDTSLERAQGGLGIGLTLVKTLVELHGGSVSVSSEGHGSGSEFTIRLPVAAPAADTTPAAATGAASAARRILIVDDNADGAESLSMLLQFDGHETMMANDGRAALEVAERFRPDVILLDIGLPGMNGYEVCRHIRATEWGSGIAVVALTGWGQEEDRNRSREAGFDTHMVKPVDHDALTRLLASIPARGDVSRSEA